VKKKNEQKRKIVSKQPRKHLNKIRMRVLPSESGPVDQGARDAKVIWAVFNQISKEFKLNPVGTEATSGYVENLIPSSPDLDFEVLFGSKRIAELDTTGSNYTFAGSMIMPVRCYKGYKVKTLNVPCYFVYWMKNEQGEVKDCCYWIKGEDVIKSSTRTIPTSHKLQDNYMTDKADWHRGLDSLIEELRKLNKAKA
jgi:hypothetical protein